MAGDVATISDPSILSNPAQMQQWSNLIESLFGSSENRTSSTQSSSAADPIIMQLLQQLMGTAGQGASAANIQALIAPIMMQLRDQTLPGIQQAANSGGGVFNSSTQRLLQNDALARATALGGEAVVKQQNNQQTQIMNLLNILAQATKSTQQQQSASKPGTASNLGKAALGAAAAKKLAKAFQNAKNPSPSAAGGTGEDDEAMAKLAMNAGGEGRSDDSDDTSGFGFSGEGDYNFGPGEYNYGDGNGLDFYGFPEDPGVDPFGIGGWDDNWGGAGADDGSSWDDGYGGAGGFWGPGNDGYYDDPETEDLGEYF